MAGRARLRRDADDRDRLGPHQAFDGGGATRCSLLARAVATDISNSLIMLHRRMNFCRYLYRACRRGASGPGPGPGHAGCVTRNAIILERMSMSDANVTYELVGNVALVGLDRAGKRNALNDEMVKQLREAVFRAGEEARAGVIHAIGDNFSAGLDLAEALTWMDPTTRKRRRSARARPLAPPVRSDRARTRSRGSRRSRARASAAGSNSRRPATSALRTRRRSSHCRKASAASSSAAAARCASRACWAMRAWRT